MRDTSANLPPLNAEAASFMAQALAIAQNGKYRAYPNPLVGAVITGTKAGNHKVLAIGWHNQCGGPHAEASALTAFKHNPLAKEYRSSELTCYVTLEPCNHHGRTPPCSQALINAGIGHVCIATLDPNQKVQGGGAEALRTAGIQVTLMPQYESQACFLNRGYNAQMQHQKSWVQLKLAMSLDGKLALASGESKWITGAHARQQVQTERAQSQLIVTGGGTYRVDKPSLNVRYEHWTEAALELLHSGYEQPQDNGSEWPQPQRVVVTSDPQLKPKGWETITGANLPAELQALTDQYQAQRVMVEAGATLSASMLKHNLVDELLLFTAPILLGSNAQSALQLPMTTSLSDAHNDKWHLQETKRYPDGDLMARYCKVAP